MREYRREHQIQVRSVDRTALATKHPANALLGHHVLPGRGVVSRSARFPALSERVSKALNLPRLPVPRLAESVEPRRSLGKAVRRWLRWLRIGAMGLGTGGSRSA
jgi:hypothetical protein